MGSKLLPVAVDPSDPRESSISKLAETFLKDVHGGTKPSAEATEFLPGRSKIQLKKTYARTLLSAALFPGGGFFYLERSILFSISVVVVSAFLILGSGIVPVAGNHSLPISIFETASIAACLAWGASIIVAARLWLKSFPRNPNPPRHSTWTYLALVPFPQLRAALEERMWASIFHLICVCLGMIAFASLRMEWNLLSVRSPDQIIAIESKLVLLFGCAVACAGIYGIAVAISAVHVLQGLGWVDTWTYGRSEKKFVALGAVIMLLSGLFAFQSSWGEKVENRLRAASVTFGERQLPRIASRLERMASAWHGARTYVQEEIALVRE